MLCLMLYKEASAPCVQMTQDNMPVTDRHLDQLLLPWEGAWELNSVKNELVVGNVCFLACRLRSSVVYA